MKRFGTIAFAPKRQRHLAGAFEMAVCSADYTMRG
jgi:hypothetical protein